jgi:hypothetical protein
MWGRGAFIGVAGVLAVALVGVGCGGGSSELVANVELSKPTYMKKAEAVCKKNYEKVREGYESFVKSHGGPENAFKDPADSAKYAEDVVVGEKKKTVEELKALGAPKGEEDQVEAIVEAYEEGIEVGEENPVQVMSSNGVFAYATYVAEEYGLESCRY